MTTGTQRIDAILTRLSSILKEEDPHLDALVQRAHDINILLIENSSRIKGAKEPERRVLLAALENAEFELQARQQFILTCWLAGITEKDALDPRVRETEMYIAAEHLASEEDPLSTEESALRQQMLERAKINPLWKAKVTLLFQSGISHCLAQIEDLKKEIPSIPNKSRSCVIA